MAARDIYIIAGEPSGDRLGGGLMRAMQAEADVSFHGVGGRDMIAAGLEPPFDMRELSVMGLTEVLPKLRRLIRRINETAADVIARRPAALITIDSPDFCLRVARKARAAQPGLPVVHYVAPSVWAWRPGRAKKMAPYVDHVLALLPFEPPYMQAAGMSCDFVGHPAAERTEITVEEIAGFRNRRGIRPAQKVLLVAPGSRRGEVNRLLGPFTEVIGRMRAQIPDLAIVCPVAETVEAEVRGALSTLLPPAFLVLPQAGEHEKRIAFAAADAALCASGTITLELAAAGTPMVAAYRTNWLTAQIVRRVVKVSTANLVNLVSERAVVPEFLQEYCTVDAVSEALSPLLTDPAGGDAQRAVFDQVMAVLGREGNPPSIRAAQSVLEFLDRRGA
ncbi:MAG: lipid-A-disaccharide synthase [Pseudomonadota bacterium]